MNATAKDRLLTKVIAGPNCCWQWTGSKQQQGYGFFWNGERSVVAHRASYEMFVGPIPEGLQLDHLCRNTSCVNPQHLEPVTAQENTLRGTSPAVAKSQQTHCKRGHALTGDNVGIQTRGTRYCKACKQLHNKARYAG